MVELLSLVEYHTSVLGDRKMDAQDMKSTARRWFTGVFDNGNFDLIEEMTAEGYIWHGTRVGAVGRNALADLATTFRTAFPDLNNSFHEQVVEGNVVVTRGTIRGTHKAPLGDLPATGRTVAVPWVNFTRFDGDLIVDDWQIYDELDLMIQLGVAPESS
jgi:predicted ester cyclase